MEARVEEFLRYISLEKGYSEHTIAAYRSDLSQFVRYLQRQGVRSWPEVDRPHVLDYIAYLQSREYASSTVARKVAAVKSFFHFQVADGALQDEPSAAVDSPRVEKTLPHPLSLDEMDRLLAGSGQANSAKDLRDNALLELMYATGMRASEVIGLDVDAVDIEAGTARCLGKGNKERILPVYGTALDALSEYMERARPELLGDNEEDALFLNYRGRPLTRQGLWLIVKQRAAEVGIERDVTPHTLRHSFATHMLNGGAGLREVQQLLGHANISSTQIYTKVSTRRKRESYDKAHPRA
jgi:integrase/recombinase XerD